MASPGNVLILLLYYHPRVFIEQRQLLQCQPMMYTCLMNNAARAQLRHSLDTVNSGLPARHSSQSPCTSTDPEVLELWTSLLSVLPAALDSWKANCRHEEVRNHIRQHTS
ncbi:uncharacterized protein CLUP02_08315 [Colletotrichum lupini]|uniref:Uncharacterized protein n=1 Tax=Colletotrichum lupini TaxID=145971 RepID=A0A9Q8STL7_9PEZI|nr:uncharacterized protein CLUP02_08315 [Colletotrichum lupini]UQC82825.1 hypothetical protein CLUP02_08315 [Colletotrichum lupini]